MANEYIERVMGNSKRPELSPDGFRVYLNQLEGELDKKFIDTAAALSPHGEAEIMLALGELGQRLNIMGGFLSPRIAAHNVSNLFSMIEITRTLPGMKKISAEELNLDILRNQIVHAPDPIKRLMFNNRLILPIGKHQLKNLDRTSPYYKMPGFDMSIEMEDMEDAGYGPEIN